MAKKGKEKPIKEVEDNADEHRPLVTDDNKFPPVKQIYSGFEIEKRYLLKTIEDDFTPKKNATKLYNEVLEKGTIIRQGYILDIEKAKEMLDEFGIDISFKPNTIRLRQYGKQYILTLKNRKETKKREAEWELDKAKFNKWWKETKGKRIEKKRLVKKIKGWDVEYDAFTDRYLLLAEIEVTKESDLKKVPILGQDITNNSLWTNKNMSR